jgi:hypothetical protein
MIAKPYLPWGDMDEIANRVLRAAAIGRAVTDLIGGEVDTVRFTGWLAEQKRAPRNGKP